LVTNFLIETLAREAGFTIVGFAPADLLTSETNLLKVWLDTGYHSGMKYMERNLDKRENVNVLLPGALSVISLAMNYYPGEFDPVPENCGKISRYAWGTGYHELIGDKCRSLLDKIKESDQGFVAVFNVDSGPVMDKAWAVRAGIGWQGKNSNVINPKHGSWFFLATIICNREFSFSQPVTDHCGRCTACIEACPTKAITQEYVIDSNKCISYLTIENKGDIPHEFTNKFEGWAFGCDICQEVCPWNLKFSELTDDPEYIGENRILEKDMLDQMNEAQFKDKFRNSPISRAKLKGIKRNLDFLFPEAD